MSKQIEKLSKDLAGGMSRRKAFWRFFLGIGGVVIAGGRASAGAQDICAQFCSLQQQQEGRDFGACMAASARCPEGECANVLNGTTPICVPVG